MIGHASRSILTAVATAAALLALAAGGGGQAAAAEKDPGSSLDFTAEPAAGSSTDEAASYFVIGARPGRPVRQAVAITNETSSRVTLVLHGEAATTGPLGGISYGVQEREAKGAGVDWLVLGRTRVTLAPKASTLVPFTVRMPAGGEPGVHVAGISVERLASRTAASEQQAGPGAGVIVHARRVVAVQVDVPGRKVDRFEITKVTAAPRPDAMYLLVHVRNQGNTLLTRTTGRLKVTGDAPLVRKFPVDTFLPRTSIRYPIRWTKKPREGRFEASVKLTSGGITERWSGTVKVGQKQLRQFDVRSGDTTASAGRPRYLLPALGGFLLLTLAVVLIRRRSASRSFDSDAHLVE